MIGTIIHQLTRNLTDEQARTAGFDTYFVDRTTGVYPTAASGFPYSAASMAVKGDVIADLSEDMAADGAIAQEQPTSKTIGQAFPTTEYRPQRRRFSIPYQENRNAAFFMPSVTQ